MVRRNGTEIRIRCSERTMQTKRLSTYCTNGSSSLPEVVDARQQSGYNVIVQCRHQRKNEKVASASAVAPLSPRRLECRLALTMCGKTRQPHGSEWFPWGCKSIKVVILEAGSYTFTIHFGVVTDRTRHKCFVRVYIYVRATTEFTMSAKPNFFTSMV